MWYVPGSFSIVRMLGRRYSLRCVLFHDISDTETPFTKGLGGTLTRKRFESVLKFLTKHYTPVSLQEVLTDFDGRRVPHRPVLVTFDDAYKTVSEFAAPLCSELGLPSVFFVNASCLDNQQLALDNLVCYVANIHGLDTINAAIRSVCGTEEFKLRSLTEVFARFLPSVTLPARKTFRDGLLHLASINERDLAVDGGLYLNSKQLRELAAFGCEIGNHTYTHVNCRSLSRDEFAEEIDHNRAVLEAVSGTQVRSFSVPYGSSVDLTCPLLEHLQQSGHEAVFLAESRANSPRGDRFRLNRVSIKTDGNASLFSEIEVLPRLRALRDEVRGASSGESQSRMSNLETATKVISRGERN